MILNYGLKGEKLIVFPCEYGYGDYYIQRCEKWLVDNGVIKDSTLHLHYYCRENGIVLRANKQERCLLRELKQYKEGKS